MGKHTRGKEFKGTKGKEMPRSTVYVFAEGQTEIIYLKHYESREYNVYVVPIDSGHTDAVGIVKFAKNYISQADIDIDLGDCGYCVFDSDPESNPNISEAFNLLFGYQDKGLKFIFSNPSFEVWFALHFGNAPHGYTANKMKAYIKELVKDDFQNYSETTDLFDYLQSSQSSALKRAKALHISQSKVVQKTVYSHECNPYTNIFEFIEYMNNIKEKKKYKK